MLTFNFIYEDWARKAIAPFSPELLAKAIEEERVEFYGDDEFGAILVQDLGEGVAEWHWLIRPGVSMCEKKKEVNALVGLLRSRGFKYIVGVTPADNLPARIMNRYFGGKRMKTRDDGTIEYLLDLTDCTSR